MPNHPDFRNDDRLAFERNLDAFFPTASRAEIILAVGYATQFIDDNINMPAHLADPVHIKNATSLVRRATTVLTNRLATANRRIKELEASSSRPNFKFQVREFAPDINEWSEWQNAHPSSLKEVDGFLVLEENGFLQVRIVFLPEES